MFYFFHGASLESFINICKTGYIMATAYLNEEDQQKYVRGTSPLPQVFTNIYIDDIPLDPRETIGHGVITFLIDPIILWYKKCYVNLDWQGGSNENSILMNRNVPYVLDLVRKSYKYPHILTHEAIFNKRISMRYVWGIICYSTVDKSTVREFLDKCGYSNIKIYDSFPHYVKE
jgi:hypothetical protein